MRIITLAIVMALTVGSAAAKDYTARQEFTYPLAENGRVFLKSEVGEVKVHASNRKDVHIVAIKRAKNSDDQSGPSRVAELQVKVSNTPEEIRVRGLWPERTISRLFRGKSELQIDFEIEVPASARLEVDNNIGGVWIRDAGNDVVVRESIGEVRVSLADSFEPRRVYLHTRIGEVDTGFAGRTQGWLGKTFTSIMDGSRVLDVRVNIGEIRITGGKTGKPRKITNV